MDIPVFQTLMLPLLETLSDRGVWRLSDLEETLADRVEIESLIDGSADEPVRVIHAEGHDTVVMSVARWHSLANAASGAGDDVGDLP